MRWWIKAAGSYCLAHLPYGQELHFALQRRCGELRSIDTAPQLDNALLFLEQVRSHRGTIAGQHVVELGTGWVPVIPIVLSLAGAQVETYDVRRLVRSDVLRQCLKAIASRLDSFARAADVSRDCLRKRLKAIQVCDELEQVMERFGGRYLAPCDTRHLPSAYDRADVVLSNLVLECIPADMLHAVLAETNRVLRPGGCAIHRVCLTSEYAHQDPRRYNLAFLKYSQATWNRWFSHSVKHLNRLRYPQFLDLFDHTGFELVATETERDLKAVSILPRIGVAEEFRHLNLADLAVTSFSIVLQKPQKQPSDETSFSQETDSVSTAAICDSSDGARS